MSQRKGGMDSEKIIIKQELPRKIHDAYYECMCAEIPTFMIVTIKK